MAVSLSQMQSLSPQPPASMDPLEQPACMSVKQFLDMQAELARLRTAVADGKEIKLLQSKHQALAKTVGEEQGSSKIGQDDLFRWKQKMGLRTGGQIASFLAECREGK